MRNLQDSIWTSMCSGITHCWSSQHYWKNWVLCILPKRWNSEMWRAALPPPKVQFKGESLQVSHYCATFKKVIVILHILTFWKISKILITLRSNSVGEKRSNLWENERVNFFRIWMFSWNWIFNFLKYIFTLLVCLSKFLEDMK